MITSLVYRSRHRPSIGFGRAGLVFAVLLNAAVVAPSSVAMEILSDAQMKDVSARDGIAISLEVRANADAQGQPLDNACASDPLTATQCRLGLQVSGNEQEWLVLKGFYGVLRVPELHLTTAETPSQPSSHEDLSRFNDEQGVPLLDSPHGWPAIAVELPQPLQIHNLTITGFAMEYDDQQPGFRRNASGSLGGLHIDNALPGQGAEINVQGRALIYGF